MTTAMIKQVSLDQLRELLAPAEAMTRETFDPSASDGEFTIGPTGQIQFDYDRRHFGIQPNAYLGLANMLGIPRAYVERCPRDLILPHVNYWLKEGTRNLLGFAATPDGVIQVFSKGAMQPISNFMVLDTFRELAPDANEAWHVATDLFNTSFAMVTREQQYAVPGDPVRVGVVVENSYAMTEALTFSTYIHTLRCTNGQVSSDTVMSFRRRGLGDAAISDWVHDSLEQAIAAGDTELERIRTLKEIRFEGHISEAMESIFGTFNVPAGARQLVQDRVIDRGISTMYDLVDIVTDMASNNEEVLQDANLSRRLMRVAGQMTSHPELCEACHRLLV